MKKSPSASLTTSLLLGVALAASGLVACEETSDIEQAAQALEEPADSASPDASATPGKGARDGKRGMRGGKGFHGPKDHSWLFDRFDEDGDGKVAFEDLPEHKQEWLKQADANNDDFLTKDELTQHHEQRRAEFMKEADTNGDGEISDEEHAAMRAKMHEKRFAEDDTNNDGFLTEDEVDARKWKHLSRADANADDKLTLEEIQQAIEDGTLKPPPHKGRGGKGRRGPHGPPPPPPAE
jgi:hypothetical protein